MTPFKSLTFYIAGVPGEITPGHALWNLSLSGRSRAFAGTQKTAGEKWTIGTYFLAAKAFLCQRQVLDSVAGALSQAGRGSSSGTWDVSLDLQKHGAFYHPLKMTVLKEGILKGDCFVLNGAVSDHGRELAAKEAQLFSAVDACLPLQATPRVVARGEVSRAEGDAGFLMAQWLEGYYEFHRTDSPGGDVVVWRPEGEDLYLSLDRMRPAYENIARLLTLAYDMKTSAQVLFWHHAAGDFILCPDQKELPVKLITVREYGSMADEAVLAQGPLPGLFLFFVNLCLRMQLDRMDGVGAPVLLGPGVLDATARGFFKGLVQKTGEQDDALARAAWEFFKGFTQEQLGLALEQVLEAWPVSPSEQGVMAGKIGEFAGQVGLLFKSRGFFDFY